MNSSSQKYNKAQSFAPFFFILLDPQLPAMERTENQYNELVQMCKDIFQRKMKDYGTSWRIMRPRSVTDQIFIKAQRVQSIEVKGKQEVDDDIKSEFIGIVNYGIIGLIQLELGPGEPTEFSEDKVSELYQEKIDEAKALMMRKNHDYGEAWRDMRISSYTDLILMKIFRTKQIEDNDGQTIISEGISANYLDMINYAIFGLIKLVFEKTEE